MEGIIAIGAGPREPLHSSGRTEDPLVNWRVDASVCEGMLLHDGIGKSTISAPSSSQGSVFPPKGNFPFCSVVGFTLHVAAQQPSV